MEMLDPWMFAFVLGAAFFGGFVDSIAGGGGLITIPALLIAGLDPVTAIGTNKAQALFGSGSATIAYARRGHLRPREVMGAAGLSFGGAVVGALAAQVLPLDTLERGLPFLLIAIALFFAFKPGLSDKDAERRISPAAFTLFVVPLIGAYDGLFGPGTGSFFMIAFVSLAGYGVLRATAHTKMLNMASNLGGLLVFAAFGSILWKVGLSMGVAQFLGARLGASLAMKLGARLIRPLLVVVCLAMASKLLFF